MAEQRKRTTRRAVESAVAVAKNDCVDAEVLVVRLNNGRLQFSYDGAGDMLSGMDELIGYIDSRKGDGGVEYSMLIPKGHVPAPDDSEDDDEDDED